MSDAQVSADDPPPQGAAGGKNAAMAEQFTVRIDVGPDASMASIVSSLEGLQILIDAAADLAWAVAESAARHRIERDVDAKGWSALLNPNLLRLTDPEVRSHVDGTVSLISDLVPEPSPLTWRPWLWAPGTPWEALTATLTSALAAEQGPGEVPRVRSLSYSNPITAELVYATSVAPVALGYLLYVVTSLGPRRRIQAAAASDFEDQVAARREIRRRLLEGIAAGQIELRPDDVTDVLVGEVSRAADRLADRELSFDRIELRSGDDG